MCLGKEKMTLLKKISLIIAILFYTFTLLLKKHFGINDIFFLGHTLKQGFIS